MKNAERYAALDPRIARGLSAIEAFRDHPAGRYPLDGDDIYLMVQEYDTRSTDGARWEAHARYLDIQAVISGDESIGFAFRDDLIVAAAYDPSIDAEMYTGKGSFLRCGAGCFAVFYPGEPHMPGISAGTCGRVRKIVVKIRIGA